MSYKHQNLSGRVMSALGFFFSFLRFASSLHCDTLSTLRVIHHNKSENSTVRAHLVFQEHTTLCVSPAAVGASDMIEWKELISFVL